MKAFLLAICVFLISFALQAQSDADTDAEQLDRVNQHLIATVKNSSLVFVRNDHHYDGPTAASHIVRKYAHFREQISTPEQFIDLCASRSLLTGKAYEVILDNGGRVPLRDWLMQALQDYREAQETEQAKTQN
jgi:hypothetical protein